MSDAAWCISFYISKNILKLSFAFQLFWFRAKCNNTKRLITSLKWRLLLWLEVQKRQIRFSLIVFWMITIKCRHGVISMWTFSFDFLQQESSVLQINLPSRTSTWCLASGNFLIVVGQGNLSECCMNWAMQFMLWLSKWLPVHWKWFKLWKMKNFHWHQYSFKLTVPDPAQSKAVWIWYLGPGLKPAEKKV